MKNYPYSAPQPFSYSHLGINIDDPYRHLQNLESDETKQLIEAENAYSLSKYGESNPLYQKLYTELKEKIKEEDSDVPEKIENYYYYSRSLPEKEYEIHCRKKGSLDAPEEIYFDENEWAKDFSFFDLGSLELDSSQQKAIACIDSSGDEIYEAFFLNLESNEKKKLPLEAIASDIEWTNDSKAFYYLKLDDSLRPYQCYRYFIESEKSELIYEEQDPEYFLGLSSSKDEKYIFIEAHGSISSEIHYLEAKDATPMPACFAKRQNSVEYYLGHHRDSWVILSNHEMINFALYTCPKDSLAKENWKCILASDDKKYLSDFEVFDSQLVVYTRENAKDKVEFYFWDKEKWEELSIPEDCYHIESADNSNFKTELFNYTYSSMTTNPRYLRYNFNTKQTECIKKYEVPNHYQESDYQSKRFFVDARDGKKIPVSILWNKNFPLEKAKAAYIYSYAAYGFSMDCGFDRKIISLCDRGIAFVQVHARGGSDLGRAWYEDGKFLKKKNTFYDVNDVAHWLKTNYPNLSESLILSGGSAGGLMVGACVNLEPELYKLAILNVPFVDVVNTMLDTSQALTALEYDEWGNPNEEVYFKEILSYSPYNNIKPEKYPITLNIAAISDQRVRYWEALKYTQKLRANVKNPEDIYLYINTSSGHTGASGRYEYLKEIALEYNFILQQLNIDFEKA